MAVDRIRRELLPIYPHVDDVVAVNHLYGLAIAPVIKVCSRNEMKANWFDMIDISAGGVATGEATIPEVGTEIFNFILDVASGKKRPYSDQYGFHNDLCIFNPAPIT